MNGEQQRRLDWRRWFLPLAILLLLSLALQPLLSGHTPWPGDGLLHFYRLAELERSVRLGQLFPRWLPDLAYGYGFPLFNYYAPLSYYLALIPRLVGFSLATSLSISFALALLVLATGVFLWARLIWKGIFSAVIAALVAVYSPYLLYDTYHRAALAECWGLAFLAIALWATGRLLNPERPKGALLVAALSYAALILSHNITAFVGSAIIFGYALFLWWLHHSQGEVAGETGQGWSKTGLLILAFVMLGLGLSAFFWLPALLERDLVQIENLVASSDFSYQNNFLKVNELLAWPLTADPSQVNPPIPRSLGWPAIILSIIAWAPGYPLTYNQKAHRLAITLATGFLIIMTTALSQAIWSTIPLLNFLQFPWRFLGPVTLGMGMLAGLGAQQAVAVLQRMFEKSRSRLSSGWLSNAIIPLISAIILIYALPLLFPSSSPPLPNSINPADTIRFEQETGWLGTTAAADYLPRQVQELPPADSLLAKYEEIAPSNAINRLESNNLPDSFSIDDQRAGSLKNEMTYSSGKEVDITFQRFAFPGWRLRLDGETIPAETTDPQGLISASLPAGNHTVELRFESTPLRSAASAISIVSVAVFLILSVKVVTSKNGASTLVDEPGNPLVVILIATGTVILLVLVKTVYLDQADTLFRRLGFDGQQIQNGSHPEQVNFGDELMLIGQSLPVLPVPANQPVTVTLFWRALMPVENEYSVSLQLLDDEGHRFGQDDSFHPAGLPVTRWQESQYARDVHRIQALPGTPPGEYRLIAFVYETVSGERLDVLNQDGLPTGSAYEVGKIVLAPPTRYPDPDEISAGIPANDLGLLPTLGQDVQLLGYEPSQMSVATGGILPVTLYWHTLTVPAKQASATLQLVCDRQGNILQHHLPERLTPGPDWQAGQILRAIQTVPVPTFDSNGQPLSGDDCTLVLAYQDSAESDSVQISLTEVDLTAPTRVFQEPEMANFVGLEVGDIATLVGYDLNRSELNSGESIEVDLVWRAESSTPESYTVFIQLLGMNDQIIAQHDQLPVSGDRPTSGWLPGEYIADSYQLEIPLETEPGRYRLIVGLYDSWSGRRLPVGDGESDAIMLTDSILIQPAGN